MKPAIMTADIPNLARIGRGKVREIYDLGECLLLVTTDRISAYDSVMQNGIPDKGRVLTQMSRFWFQRLRHLTVTHMVATETDFLGDALQNAGVPVTQELLDTLEGRSMIGVKATVYPVECVVRGYLSGSLWAAYCQAGGQNSEVELYGIVLPGGLQESEQLPTPLFTPATKAISGHDENISFDEMATIVGRSDAEQLREVSLSLYLEAVDHAHKRGIIIADTKFEFGRHKGVLTLVDEALTPDSSRFWAEETYAVGRSQDSFDKQYVRDYLTSSGWNREPPAPALPEKVVLGTRGKYVDAFQRITGREL